MQSFTLSFFYATLKQEPSVKNKRDRLFFTLLFVPQAPQSSYDRRAELEVLLAIPSAQSACGMEDSMYLETLMSIKDRRSVRSYRKEQISKEELDAVAPENPVSLGRCDGHMIWVNSRHLRLRASQKKQKILRAEKT